MGALRNMPVTGVLVIAVIAVLFILAVILLFYVRIRYRFLEGKARGNDPEVRGFRSAVLKECQHPRDHRGCGGRAAFGPAAVRALPE